MRRLLKYADYYEMITGYSQLSRQLTRNISRREKIMKILSKI